MGAGSRSDIPEHQRRKLEQELEESGTVGCIILDKRVAWRMRHETGNEARSLPAQARD